MTGEVSQQTPDEGIRAGIEFLQTNLGIGKEAAQQIGMIEMRGPDPRCGAMAVAEFFASPHGQVRGRESLTMIREDIDSGASVEDALVGTFGRAAFTKDEHGGLKRCEANPPTDNVTPQPEGSEKK
jgi:hypothetical protein